MWHGVGAMSLSPPAPRLARVIPIRRVRAAQWQGDLLGFLLANPRHLTWLMERPVIRHFVDEVLLAQMCHARAEEVAIYHSPRRLEVVFRLEGRRHGIDVPNHRWALPVVLRLKHLAGMDVLNPQVWQVGEIVGPGEVRVNVCAYPNPRSERLVLRPRWGRLGAAAA